jgi:hypothetical protein
MVRLRFLNVTLTCTALLAGFVTFAVLSTAGSSQTRSSYIPKNGFVPDEKTAIGVAQAVLILVYGEKQIKIEEPFGASLKGDTWPVHGSMPKGYTLGGVAEVEISKANGCILHMIHGK